MRADATEYERSVCSAVLVVCERHRERQGWSHTQFLESVGLSYAYMANMRHRQTSPSVEVLVRLAEACELSLGAFMTEVEAEANLMRRQEVGV